VSDLVGRIIRLQVQTGSVKASGRYDPSPILAAETASISEAGMLLWNGTAWVIDAHHRMFPGSRGGGRRPLSIGFTSHYAEMERHFGDVPVGIAGENIIVEGPALRMADIDRGLVIRRSDGGEITLHAPRPAAPCLPFTSFLVRSDGVLPREALTEELAFLSEGTRGFLVSVDPVAGPTTIRLGDEIYFLPR
jgi:hypothetical protein